ncbi:MAG TPA: flagellar hook-associated protein FlgK [Phycisphaerales bacterium]|nr:flagellar hook-associated protein FlgK [Phycisphaerales bacterium]
MGLTSSLQIGRTALSASQVGIQVTGNNLANAATPGYSRQLALLAPMRDGASGGSFIGRGVYVQGIRRQVDQALQARLWSGLAQESSAGIDFSLLSSVEATLNELSDSDLSSELSAFFGSWSELANSPSSASARGLVVQQGGSLASAMRTLRRDLGRLREQADAQLSTSVRRADELLSQVAGLNAEIVTTEGGGGQASGLRDQRDRLIGELNRYLDVSTIEHPSGAVDVLVGSTPVVLAGTSRGIELARSTESGALAVAVTVRADGQTLGVTSGSIGALQRQRAELVEDTIARLDRLASQLIYQVNRIHSTGYAGTPLTSASGTLAVPVGDRGRALNDPANATLAALPYAPTSGGFFVTVTNTATGAAQTVRIDVDLDGVDASGAPGFADDTSLDDLTAALGAVPNLTAQLNPDGSLALSAAEGYSLAFSEDTSGVLAVLGVNSYFTGTSAGSIGVRGELAQQPGLLSVGLVTDGSPADNGAALAMVALQDRALGGLGGRSLRDSWLESVQSVGLRTDAARTRAEATTLVREGLEAQHAAVSGVSTDEEAINLMTHQRQYEGAARFITIVDELMQTLMNMV